MGRIGPKREAWLTERNEIAGRDRFEVGRTPRLPGCSLKLMGRLAMGSTPSTTLRAVPLAASRGRMRTAVRRSERAPAFHDFRFAFAGPVSSQGSWRKTPDSLNGMRRSE